LDNPPSTELNQVERPSGQKISESFEAVLPVSELIVETEAKPTWRIPIRLGKIFLFSFSLYLFVLAINLMKAGARGITPFIRDLGIISNPIKSLGFGWLFSYLILSGSPVAAVGLTFFDAGLINEYGTFTMITGSRLGASFIVLFIGFIYVLRGRDRATSLSMGILSLTVTATTYLPGLMLGIILLNTGGLDNIQFNSSIMINSFLEGAIYPVESLLTRFLPPWAIFLTGLGVIVVSLNLFDKCLPQMTLKESQIGWVSRLVYRPIVMFIMGAMVTMISMSVSISLSLLVPLSQRGFVRRENVIPYIMGANITTFIDTLLAAVLLQDPTAFTIVVVEMISVSIISIAILIVFYQKYHRSLLNFSDWVTATNTNLTIFMFTILITPLILFVI
jgi:sodium-dependent phosphate cotransporter